MAFCATRTAFRLASNLNKTSLMRSPASKPLSLPFGHINQIKPLSRSIWHLSNSKTQHDKTPCGCCGFHGNADKELSDFLTKEVELEKGNIHALPSLEGFTLEKTDGAEIVMTKRVPGETIRIKTNVNNSMDDDSGPEGGEDGQSEMVCRPPMVIELMKDESPNTLCISCEFPHPSEMMNTQEQEFIDVIEIRELAFVKKGEEWKQETFSVAGSVLDGNMYDLILSMLEERGIDGAFCDQFVTLATEYEHSTYVGFLESLQNFVKTK